LGLVPVEALGCECAVVVSDLPAMRDIVQDGKTGLVVRQKSPEELAATILRLLADRSLARKLGKIGRQNVLGRFDWQSIVNQYRIKFKDLIKL